MTKYETYEWTNTITWQERERKNERETDRKSGKTPRKYSDVDGRVRKQTKTYGRKRKTKTARNNENGAKQTH